MDDASSPQHDAKFSCDLCSATFIGRRNLRRHTQSVHTTEKSYECDSCGKSYSRSDHLKRHIRSHSRSRTQFVCGVDGCQRSYVNHEACLEHRAMHIRKLEDGHMYVKGFLVEKHIAEDVTSFVCPVEGCKKLYQSYGGISRHIARNHSGSLICGIDGCTRSFENKEPLEEHRKKHEQQSDPGICYIKGYAVKKIDKEDGTVLICPFEACSSSCQSTSGMTKHISRHISQSSLVEEIEKEPPAFICPHEGCGRIFTKRSNLHMHARQAHGDTNRYTCDECKSEYKFKSSLRKHKCAATKTYDQQTGSQSSPFLPPDE